MQNFSIVIISVLTILVFLLAIKSTKIQADKYLIAFFVTMIIGVVQDMLFNSYPEYAYLFRFGGTAVPLGAAFLHLYIRSLISDNPPTLLYLLVIFLPAAIILVISYFIPELALINSKNALLIAFHYMVKLGLPLLMLIASSYQLKKYTRELKEGFSNIDDIDFKWLKALINSSIILIFTVFIGFILYKLKVISTIDLLVVIANISLFIFILFLAFYGIKNTNTFREVITTSNIDLTGNKKTADVDQSTEADQSTNADQPPVDTELIEKLESTIESERPYLSEKLTISQLAEQTGIPQKQLSQVINSHYRQNFFDFINSYRTKEFNRRIESGDNRQFTILSIAYDCGFSSKSAFNRAYKKHVGVPPSEFLKNS
jgi:AraC-like DNA-binding protein